MHHNSSTGGGHSNTTMDCLMRKENARSASKLQCKTPNRSKQMASTINFNNYELNSMMVSSIKESVLAVSKEAEASPIKGQSRNSC